MTSAADPWPFVGRIDEQERFTAILAQASEASAAEGPSNVVLVEGLGGFGKTELLGRFAEIASKGPSVSPKHRNRFVVVRVDWQEQRGRRPAAFPGSSGPHLLTVLGTLHGATIDAARQSATGSSKLSRLLRHVTARLNAGRNLRRVFQAFDELAARTPDLATLASRAERVSIAAGSERARQVGALAAVTTTVGALTPAAPVTSVAGPLLPQAAELAKGLRQRSRRRVTPDQIDEALRPDDVLARAFAQGLRELSRGKPIVLLLDTHEIVATTSRWIRDMSRQTGGRVVWVLAGRLEPERLAGESSEAAAFRRELPEGRLRVIPVTAFSDETVRHLLDATLRSDRVNPELAAAVVGVTRGIPLAVNLVVRLLAAGHDIADVLHPVTEEGDSSDVIRELAERYLKHVREDPTLAPDTPLLYGLALIYGDRPDPEVLRALWHLEAETAETLAALAQRHDFVLTATRRLHQEVRDTLRSYLLDAARRDEVKRPNLRAKELLRQRLVAPSYQTIEAQLSDEGWRANLAAYVWHSFWADGVDGIVVVGEVLPSAILLQPSLSRELVEISNFFFDILSSHEQAVLRGFGTLISFGPFVDGWLERRSAIGGLPRPPAPLPRLRDEATAVDHELALEYLARLAQESATVLARTPSRRSVCALLTAKTLQAIDTPEALHVVEDVAAELPRAGRLAREVVRILTTIRRALSARQGDTAAQGACVRAARMVTEFAPEDPSAWASLAVALDRANEPEAALEAYDAAINLDPDEPLLQASRALTLVSLGRIDEAIAVHMQPNLHDLPKPWLLLGDKLGRLNHPDAALGAYTHVIELEPSHVEALAHRGMLRLDTRAGDFGLSDLSTAADLDPEQPALQANLGLALLENRRTDLARQAFERRVALESGDALLARVCLGALDWNHDSSTAIEQFRRALEDDGSHLSAFDRHALRAIAFAGLDQPDDVMRELALAQDARGETDSIYESLLTLVRHPPIAHYEQLIALGPSGLHQE